MPEPSSSLFRRLLTLHLVQRPIRKRVLGGVCRGLANHLRVPAFLLRLAFLVATLFAITGIWAYFALWFFIPCEPKPPMPVGHPQLVPASRPDTNAGP